MHFNLTLHVNTDKDRLTIEREISDILKKTADYQHGDITLNSEHSTLSGDSIEADFYISDCTDMGHTINVLSELIQYIRFEFL